ncbi:uncharacterized protein K452DRAFT_48738 [Aplosporella prunicola CBS 121167]|uniref:Uncharacterized protein n=1 Tax=Aplosporella prunicola CBS 121167 TaxID=1176127 RepID=A0A6A6B8U7_9PEZI|nr:uncharacterized protein K452DRAFT_48738 [Aplosporella prunicola CBS 121167]KAF2140599.1 hypothetical protein K452DRAFT_48738 [Aplosporella prunicola CBS 121167]
MALDRYAKRRMVCRKGPIQPTACALARTAAAFFLHFDVLQARMAICFRNPHVAHFSHNFDTSNVACRHVVDSSMYEPSSLRGGKCLTDVQAREIIPEDSRRLDTSCGLGTTSSAAFAFVCCRQVPSIDQDVTESRKGKRTCQGRQERHQCPLKRCCILATSAQMHVTRTLCGLY